MKFLPAFATLIVLNVFVPLAVVGLSATFVAQNPPLAVAPVIVHDRAAPTVGLPDFADLADRVAPAVVNIHTATKDAPPTSEEEDDDEQGGIPLPKLPPSAPKKGKEERPLGIGSGFILSSDGYVITNAHVVAHADRITVRLTDKRHFIAKLIGKDVRSDVALLKIDATGLPTVKIGDVKNLRVGEWVMAIGAPFGLDLTVTNGIVSMKSRDTGQLLPLIQTDVPINPGNSGGPLFNMYGEVVGINSQIYSRSGGFQGISFAIAIDDAMAVVEQLRATGHVVHGIMGVSIKDVDDKAFDEDMTSGALVKGVVEGSPAGKAGVQVDDVITKINDTLIDRPADLSRMVNRIKPGTTVQVQLKRAGKTMTLAVTIGEAKPD